MRKDEISRSTAETSIKLKFSIDGSGEANIQTESE